MNLSRLLRHSAAWLARCGLALTSPRRAAALSVVLTGLFVAGCTVAGAASPQPSPTPATVTRAPVVTAKAVMGKLSSAATYSGNVQAVAQVPIVPKVSGRVKSLKVDVGSQVKAGDVIAELDTDLLAAQLAQAEAGLALAEAKQASITAGPRPETIDQAEANAKAAAEKLASMKEGGRSEQIAQARANLEAAEARLRDAKAGPTAEQVAVAEAQLQAAKDALRAAQAQADAALGSPARVFGSLIYTPTMKDANTGVAWEQVQLAQAQLDALKAPPRPEVIKQLEAAVDAARQQLALAQAPYSAHDIAQAEAALKAAEEQVALAKNPFTENDLKAAQAAVDQARAAVDLIKLQIKEATILAPFDGTVAQRVVSEGAVVGPTNPIVSIVSRDVEVIINVEEAHLGSLKVGQKASISAEPFAGQEIPGTVTAISPVVDARSRTVAVKISPEPGGPALFDGMFAQVRLEGASQSEAVLVPSKAVFQRDGKTWVAVVADGKANLREVKLGQTDGNQTEVLSGVNEGELVVVVGQERLADGQPVDIQP